MNGNNLKKVKTNFNLTDYAIISIVETPRTNQPSSGMVSKDDGGASSVGSRKE